MSERDNAPTTVAAVLDRLAAWAEDRRQFTRYAFARDRLSRPLASVTSPRACRWCVEGKLLALAGADRAFLERVLDALALGARRAGYADHIDANDRGGRAAVRAMIARAKEWAGDA